MKKWLSRYEKCDLCGQKIKGEKGFFVDGKTVYGYWALMCEKCYGAVGVGLGMGYGQKYDCKTAEKLEG